MYGKIIVPLGKVSKKYMMYCTGHPTKQANK